MSKVLSLTEFPGENMEQYLTEIGQFPLLSQQEEKELAIRCAHGDEDAIRTMVNSNLRLVVSVAKGYIGRGAPLLDMIQEGSIGLITAAKKFDPAMDCRFSTYATDWIREGVSRCVTEHKDMIRVPRHTADQIKKLRKARKELQQNGKPAKVEDMAKLCQIPVKKAEELLRLLPEIWSLDAAVGDADETLGGLLEDTQVAQPQDELVRQEMKQTLEDLLDQLPHRQKTVLRLRFGMEDGLCHSLSEIGQQLGISKQRAREIEQQAVGKLQKLSYGLGLEDFLT